MIRQNTEISNVLHFGLTQKAVAHSRSVVEVWLAQWRLYIAVSKSMQLPGLQLQIYQYRSKNGELFRVLTVGIKLSKQWLKKSCVS